MDDKNLKKEANIVSKEEEAHLESLDKELKKVNDGLKEIENIMVAEHKRRIESNKIMSDFIEDFLKNLDGSITNHVEDEF